jgi:ligand-binding sensor protein
VPHFLKAKQWSTAFMLFKVESSDCYRPAIFRSRQMKLTEIVPIEQWMALEEMINQRFAVDANIFDTDGYRISSVKNWVNKLCPAIKDTDKGQSFICAVAHMNLAEQARQTGQPVLEECDAGLAKIVVPIILNEQFIGSAGACGILIDDGEVDTFLVNKMTDIPESRAEKLGETVSTISSAKAQEIIYFIEREIKRLLSK